MWPLTNTSRDFALTDDFILNMMLFNFRNYFFISSPEHEVLMVRYCDQSMSVVCRASSVVNNLF